MGFPQALLAVYLLDEIPFPKRPRKLPTVLSPEEVARLIDSESGRFAIPRLR
jgi:site-specific recombinase XerD